MNVSFADVNIRVAEGVGIVSFTLQKTAGAVGPVSVQITTVDGTATGTRYHFSLYSSVLDKRIIICPGEDYVSINETVLFEIEEREMIVQTLILDNSLLEDVEEFLAFLTPIAGAFPVAVQNSIAVVSITDNDGK